MTVKELLELIDGIDPDTLVILQKDAEGNGYSPLYSVDGDLVYVPDSAYSGEVYENADPDGFADNSVDAIVLVPTN